MVVSTCLPVLSYLTLLSSKHFCPREKNLSRKDYQIKNAPFYLNTQLLRPVIKKNPFDHGGAKRQSSHTLEKKAFSIL